MSPSWCEFALYFQGGGGAINIFLNCDRSRVKMAQLPKFNKENEDLCFRSYRTHIHNKPTIVQVKRS